LGFYVTGHPLTPLAPLLEKFCLHNSATAKTLTPRTMTRIGGMVGAVQQGMSKKSGKPYAMVTLEDLEGTFSMLLMNENYDKYREHLVSGKALLVVGEVNNDEDKPKLFPSEIMPLEDAPRKFTKQVHLRLYPAHVDGAKLEATRALVETHRGKCALPLLPLSRRTAALHRNPRTLRRRPDPRFPTRRGRTPRRGNLLREGGHHATRTPAPRLGAEGRRRQWR